MKKETHYTVSNIRVVMVETTEPGNIGAAARAMKNMGLSQLCLVNPKQYPSAIATARASGADDVLANAIICQSLKEAITDCHLVIGASARQRSIKWQQTDVVGACGQIIQTINHNKQQVGVVFGTENSGLSNEQLDLCQVLMTIPANPIYPSLNISQAVQVFTYQLYQTINTQSIPIKTQSLEELASAQELDYFYQHLEQALHHLEYLDKNRPNELLIRRIRKLFSRTQLQKDEVAILRGILHKIQPYKI